MGLEARKADGAFLDREPKPETGIGGTQHRQRGGADFRADPVAGQDEQLHGKGPPLSWIG